MGSSHNPTGANVHSQQLAANVVAAQVQTNYPNQGDPGNGRCPIDLRAVTWPEGKRVDLFWTNPPGVTRIVIKRSRTFHSAFLIDEAEVIYNGPAVEHFIDGVPVPETVGRPGDLFQSPPDLEVGVPNTGVDLLEDTFYYYTVYVTVAPDPIGILDFGLEAKGRCQVTGLSITDYLRTDPDRRGRGEYLYHLFSQATRDRDAANAAAEGRTTGYLQDYARFVQGGISLMRGYTKALEQVGDASRAPAGLVGSAFDQATILANWARRFGIIPERRILDVSILRRIAESMILIYKEKGTCPSIVDFTKLLTLWDSTCAEFEGLLCNPFYLATWDGMSEKDTYSWPSSLVTIQPGSIALPGAVLVQDKYANSLFKSAMGDVFQIAGNTTSVVTFADPAAVPNVEDLLTIGAVVPVAGTIYDLTVTRTQGGPVDLNDQEYDGYQLVDSANSIGDVVATTGGPPSVVRVDSPVLPVVGAAAVAPSYLLGAAFVDRNPQFTFDLRTKCPTFLYEPLKDLDLKGADFDPFDVLFGGGSLLGTPFLPGDIILTIAAGVADAVGTSTSIVGNTLTDTTANFGPINSLSQFGLNPNRNQTALFRVVANTATTLTVSSPAPGVTLESVAKAGSRYFLLNLPNSRKYEILVRLIKLMLPSNTRIFIFFL